ncbi:MAG: metallophosphatase family protein [Spirochaetaceae bacterium]|jgi:predicted phosphodiesterase|nr:metallophosphatase family protein [Spirochaetaceae bacterium]
MRALIVSDIHANMTAFKAVLDHTRKDRDRVFCLGDLVGYGPDPNECTELAAEVCAVVLGGNHDLAAAGRLDLETFSRHARLAMEWTQTVLSPGCRAYLSGLTVKTEQEGFTLSHGGPEDPVWSYILSESDAETSFKTASFSSCFFGHTHLPSVFLEARNPGGQRTYSAAYGSPDLVVETGQKRLRLLLNPGSVGFPRDAMDAHASDHLRRAAARYALFDTSTGLWQFKRLEYDMRNTAKRMLKLGLW